MWSRVEKPRGEAGRGFLAVREGRVEGYTWAMEKKKEAGNYDLQLTDFVARTPEAARRLLSFYADHRSLAEEMFFYSSPASPLLYLLAEQAFSISMHFLWMVRITHLEKALAARGYPEGLEGELHLSVADEVLPENAGNFVLTVGGGRGEARRGGRGTLRVDIRALASLYTGFLGPAALAAAGRLEGSAGEQRLAEAIFGGALPTMPDMF
jgi:predicted acetyltransferase